MVFTLEDLVPNALIELIENNVSRIVSYPTILQYGNTLVKELNNMNIEASIFIYRDNTMQFEDDYKEIFDFFVMNDISYFKLKDNISVNYLRKFFRILQSLDTVVAMTSDNCKKALGINIETKKLLRQR